jgi:glycosyltransferase involved in cell wall biosynthesis
MRAIFVLPGFAPRPIGGYKVVYSYANYLADVKGVDVEIYQSGVFWAERGGLRARAGAMISSAQFARETKRSGGPAPWFPLSKRVRVVTSRLKPKIRLRKGDVVIATAAVTARFVAELVAGREGVAGVYFLQQYEAWAVDAKYVDQTWRLGLRNLVIAPWLADEGLRIGVPTFLVPNAIDPKEFPPGPPVTKRPRKVVGLYSARNPVKRGDLLLEVYRQIHDHDESVELHAFGVEAEPDSWPGYVVYHRSPSREELSSLYGTSRVYLCVSDAEGWHLPPAEALVSGCGVVSTRIGGVEAYAAGFALFAPVGDGPGLYSCVMAMLDDPDMNQSLVSAGRESLLAYTPEDAAELFHSELREALREVCS